MDPIAAIDDAALDRMTWHAWIDAARAWSEARAYRAGAPDRLGRSPADAMLHSAAEEASAYYDHLTAEQRRRRAAVDALFEPEP